MKNILRKTIIFLEIALFTILTGCSSTGAETKEAGTIDKEPYEFHETVTKAGTVTIYGKEYDLVYFGDWPQTIKDKSVKIDESISITMGSFTYYKGSDGFWYAKCIENKYGGNYSYSDGTPVLKIGANSTQYFKVEPIKWRVLTNDYNGKRLLLAENILTANIFYYGTGDAYKGYYTDDRTLNGQTIYPNNYKYSNIRAYLNGINNQFVTDGGTATELDVDWTEKGFLQSAFTNAAQSLIAETNVNNNAASTNPDKNPNLWENGKNLYTCDNTIDKVFLLSEQEITKSEYGFSTFDNFGAGNSRIRVPSDYAKANYALQADSKPWYGGVWWLRSPAYKNHYSARLVDADADVGNGSFNNVYRTDFSIVPALCLN